MVGEFATAIESKYPGEINGVNRQYYESGDFVHAKGEVDIDLDNVGIEVKSAGSEKAAQQVIKIEKYLEKPGLVYGPEFTPAMIRELQRKGIVVSKDPNIIIEIVRPTQPLPPSLFP